MAILGILRKLLDDGRLLVGRQTQRREPRPDFGFASQAWLPPVTRAMAPAKASQVVRCAASTFRPSAVSR